MEPVSSAPELRIMELDTRPNSIFSGGCKTLDDTPPKTNMEPENGPLEKEIPIGNHHFQVPC